MRVEEQAAADKARGRYAFHRFRLEREERERAERLAAKARTVSRSNPDQKAGAETRQALIAAALERVRVKQAGQKQAGQLSPDLKSAK